MKSHYYHLVMELLIEGFIMYFAMFAMVDAARHVYYNNNNLYMTAMMAAPMGLVMLFSMKSMFQNRKINAILFVLFVFVFLASFYAVRQQSLIDNRQFLRSMIPHHSGAILMCRKAAITDPEISTLCRTIMESQQREIDQMEAILNRY